MRCINCDFELKESIKFCPSCGKEVIKNDVVNLSNKEVVFRKSFSSKLFLTLGILSIFTAVIGVISSAYFSSSGSFSDILNLIGSLLGWISFGIPSIAFIKLYNKSSNNQEIDSDDISFLKNVIMSASIVFATACLFIFVNFIIDAQWFYDYLAGPYKFGDIFMSVIFILYIFLILLCIAITSAYVVLSNVFVNKLIKYYESDIKPIKLSMAIAVLLIIFGCFIGIGFLSSFSGFMFFTSIEYGFVLLSIGGLATIHIIGGIHLLNFVKLLKN